MSWADDELKSIDLGDPRRNKRAVKLLEGLCIKPDTSIPDRCHGWAETQAAYRFMSNKHVNEQMILEAHRQSTIERMKKETIVLCIEDTTQLDYTGHKKVAEELGPMYQPYQRGMLMHAMLATTPARVPLGVLNASFLIRPVKDPAEETGEEKKPDNRTPEEKESYRWVVGYEAVNDLAKQLKIQLVYMGDRESDTEGVLEIAQKKEADLLIRARHDRAGEDGVRMWDTIWSTPALGRNEFYMPARPGHKARIVTQTYKAGTITFPPKGKRQKSITINVVIAHEEKPPPGEEAVSWTLLTTLPVATKDDALRVVELYLCRWDIEMFFKVLKSGCAVERLQLETAARLKIAIALYLIIAFRVLMMVKLGREMPDLPCTALFDDMEWQTAYRFKKGMVLPKEPPRLYDIVFIIALMGGFLGRKSDGFPGAETLWRGFSALHSYLFINEGINSHKLE